MKCPVCGSFWGVQQEVNRCMQADMLHFIYEKLGGTFPYASNDPDEGRQG